MNPPAPAPAGGVGAVLESSDTPDAFFRTDRGALRATRPSAAFPTNTAQRKANSVAAPRNPCVLTPLAEINYAIDQGRLDSSEVEAELSEETGKSYRETRGVYEAICRAETGKSISEEKLAASRAAASEIVRQSHAIASKMAPAGFDCYRNTPFQLLRYFVHSGHVELVPAFRRVCFLPSVAQSVRAPIVTALESFLERNLNARFWTFTSGRRVPLRNVRPRVQWLHRKISQLNDADFMREAGVEIVFRSTELGTPETDARGSFRGGNAGEIERGQNGTLFFHVHAHCVVVLKRGWINPNRWRFILKSVHRFMKRQWDDNGAIRNARECCKYVTKPGEMLKLTGVELVELQAQLSRLKLVQPMGVLAAEINARRENGRRLVKRQTAEGPVLAEVPDWNRHPKKSRTEADFTATQKLGAVRKDSVQRVLARLLPACGPSGVKEPCVVVMTDNWDENRLRQDPLVAKIIADTAERFLQGLAIRVHTCTSTVGDTRSFEFVDGLAPPRHVLTGAELAGLAR